MNLCLTGAYSESRGIKIIRKHVAEFISARDDFYCSHENIYLLNGASEGIKTMLFIIMDNTNVNRKTGIMIPRPQYPLYSAAIAQLNAFKVSMGWDLSPFPQYPLYSATIAGLNAFKVSMGWDLSPSPQYPLYSATIARLNAFKVSMG